MCEFKSTTPVPFGDITIFPFVSVDEIVFKFTLILSTSKEVIPVISVVAAPSVKVEVPRVVVGFASFALVTFAFKINH